MTVSSEWKLRAPRALTREAPSRRARGSQGTGLATASEQ